MQEKQPNINHREHGRKTGSSKYDCPACKENTMHDIYEITENGVPMGTKKVCTVCREKEKNRFHFSEDIDD